MRPSGCVLPFWALAFSLPVFGQEKNANELADIIFALAPDRLMQNEIRLDFNITSDARKYFEYFKIDDAELGTYNNGFRRAYSEYDCVFISNASGYAARIQNRAKGASAWSLEIFDGAQYLHYDDSAKEGLINSSLPIRDFPLLADFLTKLPDPHNVTKNWQSYVDIISKLDFSDPPEIKIEDGFLRFSFFISGGNAKLEMLFERKNGQLLPKKITLYFADQKKVEAIAGEVEFYDYFEIPTSGLFLPRRVVSRQYMPPGMVEIGGKMVENLKEPMLTTTLVVKSAEIPNASNSVFEIPYGALIRDEISDMVFSVGDILENLKKSE